MPSPFPGMNPYLEQAGFWPDFHTMFLAVFRAILVPQVRPNYFVLAEQHLFVQEPCEDRDTLIGRSDLAVGMTSRGGVGGVALLDAPAEVEMETPEFEPIPYLEIRDRKDRHLVAVVELLSPANKRGRDRDQYLAKRAALLRTDAHLVEIDLLRGGPTLPPARPASDYSVLVSRAEDRPRAGYWPIGLRDRLPTIPVPLRSPDPGARVDLQAALDRVYDVYGYEDFLYDGVPDPALATEDDSWARSLIPRAD